jgi:ABC-type Fe3+/spermidine/putrescine transport system ATPase subunit
MSATPKLEARNISKTFTRRGQVVTALQDLSCSVATGEFVSVVGASGCGKTTLLRIIDGLEQTADSSSSTTPCFRGGPSART